MQKQIMRTIKNVENTAIDSDIWTELIDPLSTLKIGIYYGGIKLLNAGVIYQCAVEGKRALHRGKELN